MKSVYKCLLFISLGIILSFFGSEEVMAADETGVSVTVPTSLELTFREDGTNAVGSFSIRNDSPVPITVSNVTVKECNGWSLTTEGTEIPVDTKKLVFQLENHSLCAGDNKLSLSVSEYTEQNLSINIKRGAFTKCAASEKALELEFVIYK